MSGNYEYSYINKASNQTDVKDILSAISDFLITLITPQLHTKTKFATFSILR